MNRYIVTCSKLSKLSNSWTFYRCEFKFRNWWRNASWKALKLACGSSVTVFDSYHVRLQALGSDCTDTDVYLKLLFSAYDIRTIFARRCSYAIWVWVLNQCENKLKYKAGSFCLISDFSYCLCIFNFSPLICQLV